jgi:Rrf2 family protein
VISQTAEYALRVVVHLASQNGASATTRQLAIVTRVPEGYLSKVIQSLSRGGLIRSQRGLHGGSVLTRAPSEITIYDVIDAVDPIKRIRSCPLELKSHSAGLCPLHRRLDTAMGQVEKAFRESTIADLLAESNSSKPLCDVSGAAASAQPSPSKPVAIKISKSRRRR